MEVLAELELQFAKARFAQDYNCVAVKFAPNSKQQNPSGENQERTLGHSIPGSKASKASLILHNARHPLLERNLKPKGTP